MRRGHAGFSVRTGGLCTIMAKKLIHQIPGTGSKHDMVRVGAGRRKVSLLVVGIPDSMYKRIPVLNVL